jgi:hypothetical protein
MPELRKKNPIDISFDYTDGIKKTLNGSYDTMITESEVYNNRKPKKMLMPHLVNKYSIHHSITDLH